MGRNCPSTPGTAPTNGSSYSSTAAIPEPSVVVPPAAGPSVALADRTSNAANSRNIPAVIASSTTGGNTPWIALPKAISMAVQPAKAAPAAETTTTG